MFGDLVKEGLGHSGASNLAFNERIKKLQSEGETIYHFGFGQSPFPVPDCFVRNLKETGHHNAYLNVAGLDILREAISQFHQEWDDIVLPPDELVVGPGSKELIFLTMAVFKGQIWLPSPAWTTYLPQAKLAGHTARCIPTNSTWKLTAADLSSHLSTTEGPHLLVLTNPGNPSGAVYHQEELEDLVSVCRKMGVIVLSDEIYARLRFDGNHTALSKVYPEGTILTSGFSKWSSAGGWRLGYAHFPAQLSQLRVAVLGGASHTYSCAPAPLQYAVAHALTRDKEELKKYILGCRRVLEAVARYCHGQLQTVGVSGHVGKAGYYFMPDFSIVRSALNSRNILSGKEMCEVILKEAGVALMPSSYFQMKEEDLFVRFCFVNFDGKFAVGEAEGEDELDDDWVERVCPDLAMGVQRIKQWVNNQQWTSTIRIIHPS